ncbi:MAG TPA: hypothetical protein PJ991_07140 [Kiritimatiellia bacterium]|nr:hypothetical protein [Kiritimatiellia bacterium]
MAGIYLSNRLWFAWYAQLPPSPRNHAFHFVWEEYLDGTKPRRENETLLVIVSNSQGFGWEVQPREIYPHVLETIRRENAESFRVVNWSIPGARFHDILIAIAAARKIDPTHLAVITSPRTVSKTPPPRKAINTWTSQLFYKLRDKVVREQIPKEIISDMTDVPMKTQMIIGEAWPAWRNRSLPSALIAEYKPLAPFFEIRGAALWFRFPELRHNNPRRRREPRTNPIVDERKARHLIEIAANAAPHVFWINMPVRSTWRFEEETAWNDLTELIKQTNIHAINMADALPDEAFISQAHFGREGHRMFAEKLHEALP